MQSGHDAIVAISGLATIQKHLQRDHNAYVTEFRRGHWHMSMNVKYCMLSIKEDTLYDQMTATVSEWITGHYNDQLMISQSGTFLV